MAKMKKLTKHKAIAQNLPLRVDVSGEILTISIGIDTLAFAYTEVFHNDPNELNDKIKVNFVDKLQFAKDVAYEMGREDEAGNTPLSRFLDTMMDNAVNEGSTGIDFPESH